MMTSYQLYIKAQIEDADRKWKKALAEERYAEADAWAEMACKLEQIWYNTEK